ncbi:MAG: GNAT family N-acetyltransferase [Anaerolineae bacterium]
MPLPFRIALASSLDRSLIYRLRHEVYARELHQHPENAAGELSDALDQFNEYVVVFSGAGRLVGFMSITPPGRTYSLEKYIARTELPFALDGALYEFRLLAVEKAYRGGVAASLLLYASLRWVQSQGGTRVMAIGRSEVLPMYRKLGFEFHHRPVRSGAATFELMSLDLDRVPPVLARYTRVLHSLESAVEWRLGIPFYAPA